MCRSCGIAIYCAVPASFGSETAGRPPPQGHPFNPVSTELSPFNPFTHSSVINHTHTLVGQFIHASSGRGGSHNDNVTRTTTPNRAHQQLATTDAAADGRREPNGLQKTAHEPVWSSEESHLKNVDTSLKPLLLYTPHKTPVTEINYEAM